MSPTTPPPGRSARRGAILVTVAVALVLGLVVAVTLVATGLIRTGPHLERGTLDEIAAVAVSSGVADSPRGTTIWCTVSEGQFCALESAGESVRVNLPDDLTLRVQDQLDVKTIEHARSEQVRVRCTLDAYACEMDAGGGWKPIPVR